MSTTFRYRRQDGTLFLCDRVSGQIVAYINGEEVLSTSLPFNFGKKFSTRELARACDEIRLPNPSIFA